MPQKIGNLPVGAKVKETNSLYYGKPIVWRVVDKNHAGYPANSVTLQTDKIITLKCFDAIEASNSDSNRKLYGNNRYIYSNMRLWLNSSATASAWYAAQHSADAPPTTAASAGYNGYNTEAGFLLGFSANMKAALMVTTLTVARNTVTDGGGSETCTDKIFFASNAEVGMSIENGAVEGSLLAAYSDNASRLAYPTTECVNNNTSPPTGLTPNVSSGWYWWLRTPNVSYSHYVRCVGLSGALSDSHAYIGYGGARPLCNLSSQILVSDSTDSDGAYTIVWNTAPTAPTNITLPTTLKGGVSFQINWSGTTDAEGNLQGYYVQRSIDGGTSWTQIYQGSAAYATDVVMFGITTTVQYRVKAYDTEGLESAWYTSASKTVVNNTAPSTPASITVPLTVVGGETLTVSWAASTDSDGNLSGYRLERSINSSSAYTEIYTGTGLSYTDSITKGWTSVIYRVKAYDSYDEESSYTTSATRTVDNNTAPTITSASSGNLGTKDTGFNVTYSVNDEDGDTVTVTETMDGVVKRSFTATLGATNTFAVSGDYFMQILNGIHTMVITATDSKGKSTTLTLTFTKAVYACSITLETPMDTDALISKTVMSIVRNIPADAEFTVLVTNNANDTSPVWEDVTSNVLTSLNYVFENTRAINGNAFNFIITAKRGASNQGGYIVSIGGAFE